MNIKSKGYYFIVITSLITVLFVSFSVQAYEYPSETQERFIRNCLTVPLQNLPFEVNISREDRSNYCYCLLNYLQSNLPYEEYQRIRNIIITNIQLLQSESEFLSMFKQGLISCYNDILGIKTINKIGSNSQSQRLISIRNLENNIEENIFYRICYVKIFYSGTYYKKKWLLDS